MENFIQRKFIVYEMYIDSFEDKSEDQ